MDGLLDRDIRAPPAEVGDEMNAAVDTVTAGQRPTVETLANAGPAPYRMAGAEYRGHSRTE